MLVTDSFSAGPTHQYQTQHAHPPPQQRQPSLYYSRSRCPSDHYIALLRPWIPVLVYVLSSLVFLVAIAFYRSELFEFLDDLSIWLRADRQFGHAVLFALIFLTTIPPIPLYSTLIILSGYTFGPWTGAIISYFAALTGAISVFLISRTLLRDSISRWLASTITIKRVVRAIEKRPKLLFLIRLAPYPYNVMNCLLAASPSLTLRTYTLCTALSLFKVIIHTSVGASIHSFKDYHVPVRVILDPTQPQTQDPESQSQPPSQVTLPPTEETSVDAVARMWTIVGIALCIAILAYLSYVARRAVDEELDDENLDAADSEETLAFLAPSNSESASDDLGLVRGFRDVDGDLEAGLSERPMSETRLEGQVFQPSVGARWSTSG